MVWCGACHNTHGLIHISPILPQALKKVPLLRDMDPAVRARLAAALKPVTYRKGDDVIKQVRYGQGERVPYGPYVPGSAWRFGGDGETLTPLCYSCTSGTLLARRGHSCHKHYNVCLS